MLSRIHQTLLLGITRVLSIEVAQNCSHPIPSSINLLQLYLLGHFPLRQVRKYEGELLTAAQTLRMVFNEVPLVSVEVEIALPDRLPWR